MKYSIFTNAVDCFYSQRNRRALGNLKDTKGYHCSERTLEGNSSAQDNLELEHFRHASTQMVVQHWRTKGTLGTWVLERYLNNEALKTLGILGNRGIPETLFSRLICCCKRNYKFIILCLSKSAMKILNSKDTKSESFGILWIILVHLSFEKKNFRLFFTKY